MITNFNLHVQSLPLNINSMLIELYDRTYNVNLHLQLCNTDKPTATSILLTEYLKHMSL